MTKEKHPLLLAVAAVSLAAALAACDQAPAAGALGAAPAPGAPATPAAEPQPGIVGDTIVIAIKADDTAPAARQENVVQHGQRIDKTLSFPSDFTYSTSNYTHRWAHEFDRPDITQEVLDRGGIVPWLSLDGGASWIASSFSFHLWSIAVTARVGAIKISVEGFSGGGMSRDALAGLVQAEAQDNPIMLRLFVLRATGT